MTVSTTLRGEKDTSKSFFLRRRKDEEVQSSDSAGATDGEEEHGRNDGPTTLDTFKDQQNNILPHNKLMVVFPTIALAQMISYLDQTSVSTAVPAIGAALDMGPSISWVATSFLLASTSIQLINGRLSDIVGRKPLLLTCMGILACANLCAGFSQNSAMLFAFRSIAGLGGGAMYVYFNSPCTRLSSCVQTKLM